MITDSYYSSPKSFEMIYLSTRWLAKETTLSNSVRNLGVVSDSQLNLNEQMNSVKRKVIVNLINIFRIANFIDKDSKIRC